MARYDDAPGADPTLNWRGGDFNYLLISHDEVKLIFPIFANLMSAYARLVGRLFADLLPGCVVRARM